MFGIGAVVQHLVPLPAGRQVGHLVVTLFGCAPSVSAVFFSCDYFVTLLSDKNSRTFRLRRYNPAQISMPK